jgi:hypothetical protein
LTRASNQDNAHRHGQLVQSSPRENGPFERVGSPLPRHDRLATLRLVEAGLLFTVTEALIQQALERLLAGRTAIVIAHRLSTIRNADVICVVKDGRIVEAGRHAALLKRGGVYAELYRSQFGAEGQSG